MIKIPFLEASLNIKFFFCKSVLIELNCIVKIFGIDKSSSKLNIQGLFNFTDVSGLDEIAKI